MRGKVTARRSATPGRWAQKTQIGEGFINDVGVVLLYTIRRSQ